MYNRSTEHLEYWSVRPHYWPDECSHDWDSETNNYLKMVLSTHEYNLSQEHSVVNERTFHYCKLSYCITTHILNMSFVCFIFVALKIDNRDDLFLQFSHQNRLFVFILLHEYRLYAISTFIKDVSIGNRHKVPNAC